MHAGTEMISISTPGHLEPAGPHSLLQPHPPVPGLIRGVVCPRLMRQAPGDSSCMPQGALLPPPAMPPTSP
jgi:hypothetical protein